MKRLEQVRLKSIGGSASFALYHGRRVGRCEHLALCLVYKWALDGGYDDYQSPLSS